MKSHQPGISLVKFVAARAVKALMLGLAILVMMTSKVSAANTPAPACNVEDILCASPNPAQLNGSAPQLVISDATFVHTGPGSDYYSYGDLPAGYISQVVAISEDGNWWAIPLPVTTAPDGLGWVSSSAVTVKNVQAMPGWLEQCDPLTYCGYILSHSPQYIPIKYLSSTTPGFEQAMPGWLEHCDRITYCGYILSHTP